MLRRPPPVAFLIAALTLLTLAACAKEKAPTAAPGKLLITIDDQQCVAAMAQATLASAQTRFDKGDLDVKRFMPLDSWLMRVALSGLPITVCDVPDRSWDLGQFPAPVGLDRFPSCSGLG